MESQSTASASSVGQTSHIESEMQAHSGSYVMPESLKESFVHLEPILTQAFVFQPLLGNVTLSTEQREEIYSLAGNVLAGALESTYLRNYGLNDFFCDILVLETALSLRNWSDGNGDDKDGGDASSFWEYICNQYALPYDYNFGNSDTYKIFKYAIRKCLSNNKRLFIDYGHKYYTTLLTHALAPKTKFYDLFGQIFAFYAQTLKYQYIKGDPAFRAFSYAMKNRFESGSSRTDDDVYIKSVQSSSAIRSLFLYCPEYMIDFIERIVCNIDTLVAVGKIKEASYLDKLLLDWNEKRTTEERTFAKRERLKGGIERTVTDFSNIRPMYRYESGRVSLIIPSIRLGEESDKQPWITIYRSPDDKNPFSERLNCYGNYFCITSSKKSFSISELLSEDDKRIELRVVISYNGEDIYDSGSKLHRDAIIFGAEGDELVKRPDKEYVNIFVAEKGDVDGEDTSPDCAATSCVNGYIYRVFMDENTFIVVNGINLFPIEYFENGLTFSVSVAPVSHCKYLYNQQEYLVYTQQPSLTITSEEQSLEKRYRFLIDNTIHPLIENHVDSRYQANISLPGGKGIHELRVVDNTTQKRIYSMYYLLVDNFSLDFNGFYSFDNNNDNGSVDVSDNDGIKHYTYEILPEQEDMIVPYLEGELILDIPMLRCHFNGEVIASSEERIFWHDDVPMSALLEVDVPRGYRCFIMLGQRCFETNKIEIGNEIRTKHDSKVETVGVFIRRDNDLPVQIKLFDVVYKPSFQSIPLIIENKKLVWRVEDNFIGDAESEFEIYIRYKNSDIGRYRVGCKDEVISITEPLIDGIYDYIVFKKSPSLFASFEEFDNGQFIVGDPAMFKFEDRAVVVTEAILENERLKLKQSSGIITNLHYIGEQPLNGETLHYPCYEGCLKYKHNGKLNLYANREYIGYDGIHREEVNPIKLWVINDYTISLRNPSDDGLYINKKWESITDRTPRKGIDGVDNPDYYSYKIIMQSEVQDV